MRGTPLSRIALSVAALALAVLAVLALLDRMGDNARASARQALLMRAAELDRSALLPGSMLPCVDGTAGEAIGNACEARVFASPQSAAAAVAYMGARIDLLSEAQRLARRGDNAVLPALGATRRAVALDRYGIAAHVLAGRDGCTPQHCAVFAALDNADGLKANLKAQTFAQYVSRYADAWERAGGKPTPPAALGPAVSSLPAETPVASAGEAPGAMPTPRPRPHATAAAEEAAPAVTATPGSTAGQARAEATPPAVSVVRKPGAKPVSSRWHFPSADSIPAVSIMAPEPKLPKDVAARLDRDTARKTAIERRKEGKDPAAGLSTSSAAHAGSKHTETKRDKEAEKNRQEPGAPLQLTR